MQSDHSANMIHKTANITEGNIQGETNGEYAEGKNCWKTIRKRKKGKKRAKSEEKNEILIKRMKELFVVQ